MYIDIIILRFNRNILLKLSFYWLYMTIMYTVCLPNILPDARICEQDSNNYFFVKNFIFVFKTCF